jgi:hypothetical protein
LDLGFTQSLNQELRVGVLGLSILGLRSGENDLENQKFHVAKRELLVERGYI